MNKPLSHVVKRIPFLNSVQELIKSAKRRALSPDTQPTHIDHILGLGCTCDNRVTRKVKLFSEKYELVELHQKVCTSCLV